MTCAACAARVQAGLNKVTGVTASVNLTTERAYISAPATVSAPALTGVIVAGATGIDEVISEALAATKARSLPDCRTTPVP